jgi:hypothetical protein
LNAGIRGVRKGAGHTPPRIAIHIDKGGHWDTTEWYFDHLNAAHVRYDIIYPPWGHGTLNDLWNNMNQCALRYHKLPCYGNRLFAGESCGQERHAVTVYTGRPFAVYGRSRQHREESARRTGRHVLGSGKRLVE